MIHSVNAIQTDRTVLGRFHLTTEAKCPCCGAQAAYAHIDSHYSMGRWYGCTHLKSCNWSEDGVIETIEFEGMTQ